MKLRLKDFVSVNLHDSKLVINEERPDYLRLEMDVAIIGLPLRSRECENWIIHGCSLECFGVTSSVKREWERLDGRIERRDWDNMCLLKPSDQSLPINEIADHEAKNGFLVLSGYTKELHWAMWRIEAELFELNWKTQEEF